MIGFDQKVCKKELTFLYKLVYFYKWYVHVHILLENKVLYIEVPLSCVCVSVRVYQR